MNKQNIAISFVAILIIISLIYFTQGKQKDSANTSPTIQYTETTTVGSVPDVNPAGRVNPLKDVKTNPFE